MGTNAKSCCQESIDCVDSTGKCIASGDVQTYTKPSNNEKYICKGGSWKIYCDGECNYNGGLEVSGDYGLIAEKAYFAADIPGESGIRSCSSTVCSDGNNEANFHCLGSQYCCCVKLAE